MSVRDGRPALAAIVGPSAVGKSRLAIEIALRLDGEIVSADSRLLYRGMDIGTDKPSLAERERVRHHLIDVAEPAATWSLAEYCREAQAAIASIHRRGRLPILVGGTGQYVRALLEGWALQGGASDPHVRQAWLQLAQRTSAEELYQMLADTDPVSAARIDRRNVRRVLRALEVHQITGMPASLQPRRETVPFRYLVFGITLPREELYRRIDDRIDAMIARGLVDEVKRLLSQGVPPDAPSLSAIGYAQVVRFLEGKCSLETAIAEIRKQSRALVRHQANWLRLTDPEIEWHLGRPGIELDLTERIKLRMQGAG
jgi:tRNA dimethylallyltransferase